MTDQTLAWVSGGLFIVFSVFAVWLLRRQYLTKGKLDWFGVLVHFLVYGVHGMFGGTLLWGNAIKAPPMGRLGWLGVVLMVIGGLITIAGMGFFRGFGRWLGSRTPGLQTGGLYRFSRNPQFVGYGILLLGFAVAWWRPAALLALAGYAALAYAITRVEEEHLARIYGQAFLDYCARVPRYLGVPRGRETNGQ